MNDGGRQQKVLIITFIRTLEFRSVILKIIKTVKKRNPDQDKNN